MLLTAGCGQDASTRTAGSTTSPTTVESSQVETDSGIEGEWIVHALFDAAGQPLMDTSRPEVLPAFHEGDMSGHTGCNGIFGRYEQPGDDELRFPPRTLGTQLRFCRDEPPLLGRLHAVRYVSGTGDAVRYLHDEDGAVVAELRR